MITVGVKELKQQASELIRMVRSNGSEVQVTYHGRVVARIIPADAAPAEEGEQNWVDLDRLAEQIGRKTPAGASAQDTLEEGRR